MASIKVKFRPSTNENKEGTIYYQVIQNRVIRQLKTDYRLFMHEWNEEDNLIITTNNSRQNYLQSIEKRIDWDIKRLQSVINQFENKRVKYSADDIISTFQKQANEQSLFNFMQGVIAQLQQMGKQRTSETYRCTLKSFMQFREDKDVLLDDIDSDLMLMYEAYLHNRGLTKNSTSFYMRILRAVYNRAVEKDLTTNRNPFKHVYTGIDKTIKRAIHYGIGTVGMTFIDDILEVFNEILFRPLILSNDFFLSVRINHSSIIFLLSHSSDLISIDA